ncbi:MAG: TVP38/TMEM64 family protein [Chloroflexi bacterium]|nr:TVP38/TMEM64 family protein [Chloroflexota bacterium]
MNRRREDWLLAAVLLAMVAGAAAATWRSGVWRYFVDRQLLEALLARLGPWGPVGIVLAEIAQVLVITVPGQVIGLAAGYLYGAFWGTVYVMIGLTAGTALAIWIARRLGRPAVERLIGRTLLERLDAYAQRHGPLAFLIIFLLPFMPDDLACYAVGLTSLRIGELVLLAFLGRAPGVIISTWIGARAATLSWRELLLMAAIGVTLSLLFARFRRRVEGMLFRLLDALKPRCSGARSVSERTPERSKDRGC